MKVIAMILTAASTLTAGAQTLTFEKTLHDFGDLTGKETVSTTLKYSNTGDQQLVIKNVRTTCGCAAGVPAKTVLEPGEESTVEVSFVAKGKRGKQRKPITFTSNDPEQREQIIYITANVITLWTFTPSTVNFYVTDRNYESHSDTFTVENLSNETLTVQSIKSKSPRISVLEPHRIEREVEPGGSTTYTIAVDPTYFPTRQLKYVRVTVRAKIGDDIKVRTLGVYIRKKRKSYIKSPKPETVAPEAAPKTMPEPGIPAKIEPGNSPEN